MLRVTVRDRGGMVLDEITIRRTWYDKGLDLGGYDVARNGTHVGHLRPFNRRRGHLALVHAALTMVLEQRQGGSSG